MTGKTEFDLVADDMSKEHAKLNLPLNEEKNIPYVGFNWDRVNDTINFNGSFTLSKKK